jgi:hypothetical protein
MNSGLVSILPLSFLVLTINLRIETTGYPGWLIPGGFGQVGQMIKISNWQLNGLPKIPKYLRRGNIAVDLVLHRAINGKEIHTEWRRLDREGWWV